MTPSRGALLETRRPGGDGGAGFGVADHDPPAGIRDGGGSGWAHLTRAPNDIEAHLLVGRLEEAGIETSCVKERNDPGAWLHGGSNAWAPVTVLVRRFQLEDARLVLAEVAYDAPPVEPHSVRPRSRWRGPVLFWATAIGLGVLFTGLGLVQAANDMDRCADPANCRVASP